MCVHVNAKGTCCAKCETGNRNCVYVTTKKDRLITKLAGRKDFCDRQGHCKNFNCKNSCLAVDHVHFTNGYPQKKGVNPNYCYPSPEINQVNYVSCVDQLSSVKNVTNVPTVFQRKWATLGISPKVLTVLREGRLLPVLAKLDQVPNHKLLCKSPQEPLPVGGIASAVKQECNRVCQKPRIPGLLQLAIFGSKTHQPVETYTGPEHPKTKSFKMEIPETIRTSLQAGEWITSIGFKDTCFHITIHSQSRKYMRFHLQSQSYQFEALPFGLSTAPMEFTVVVKDVKLLALRKGTRIHQYLEDWLVRARSHQTCLQHTQTLVALSGIGLASEQKHIRTGSKTGFQLRRLPVRSDGGQGQTHPRALADPTSKDKRPHDRSGNYCP